MAGLLDSQSRGGKGLLDFLTTDEGSRLGLTLLAASSPQLRGLGDLLGQQDQMRENAMRKQMFDAQIEDRNMRNQSAKAQQEAAARKQQALSSLWSGGTPALAPLMGDSASGIMPSQGAPATQGRIDVQAALQALHPVGSIYINATNSTNPGTLLGFGTWTAFGAGRVPVGFDSGNALFDTAEETGGSADAITVSHTHTATTTITDPGHLHAISAIRWSNTNGFIDNNGSGTGVTGAFTPNTDSATTGITAATTVASTGSSGTNANYQPYITVYMWKRVS